MKNKIIRVLIEIPEQWVDLQESPLGWTSRAIMEQVHEQLKDALTEQYLNKITLPKIKIDPKELKDRMLTILAERALENGVSS